MSKTKTKEIKTEAGDRTITLGNRKMSFTKEERVCGILLLVLILLVAFIRNKFSGIAFERDEGIYAYNGLQILKGKTPYIDFYEQKFPGIFYFYAMMVAIFGQTVEGLHFGWLVLNIVSILFLYAAVKGMFSPSAAIITAITFAFVSLSPSLSGFTTQAEHAVVVFICLGIYFYSKAYRDPKWIYYFLMGLSMGMAFMVKTSGVFLILFAGCMAIADFLFQKEKTLSLFLRNTLTYSAGVLLVLLVFFLIIAAQGAVEGMIYFGIEIPKKYVGKIPLEEGKKYFKYTLDALVANHKFLWVHAGLSVVLLFFRQIPLKLKVFGLLLAGFSFFTIVPGYYFYGHYWIQLVPALAVLSGMTYWGIQKILTEKMNVTWKPLPYAYLAVFVVFTLMHLSKLKSYYFHPNYDLILRQVYGDNPFPEAKEIANFINRNAKPEDQIVVIGSEPQIYFYTQKQCPSRHAYFAALVADVPEHKEWQREFVRDVEKANPKYFVFFRHGISLFVQPNTDSYIFDWVNKYATEKYKVVGIVDMNQGQQSTYVWNQDVNTYQPVSQNVIYIFERTT